MRLGLLTACLSALLSGFLVLVPAAPAQAADATPGCITRSEYRNVRIGATLERARQVIGATGRTTWSSSFSDGDGWRTVEFRQCRRTWRMSSVSFDFEKTEREVYVEDWYCDDWGCEDWGSWETRYSKPFRVSSKYAYWF